MSAEQITSTARAERSNLKGLSEYGRWAGGKISAVFRFACNKGESLLPAYVPRDRTTKIIIAAGAAIYTADVWNPTSPIGEAALMSSFAIAAGRGVVICTKNRAYEAYIDLRDQLQNGRNIEQWNDRAQNAEIIVLPEGDETGHIIYVDTPKPNEQRAPVKTSDLNPDGFVVNATQEYSYV